MVDPDYGDSGIHDKRHDDREKVRRTFRPLSRICDRPIATDRTKSGYSRAK